MIISSRRVSASLTIVLTVLPLSVLCAAASNVPKPAGRAPVLKQVSNTAGLLTALASLKPDGGTVQIEPGIYVVDNPINVKGISRLNLVGSGWNAVIQKRGSGDVFVFTDCGHCVVRNLAVSGDSSATSGSGIVFRGRLSSSCSVDYCRISGFPESGLRFEGGAKAPLSSNVVRYCDFIGNLGDQLVYLYSTQFQIIGNRFDDSRGRYPRTGCALVYSTTGSYTMNYHSGNIVALRLGAGSNFNRIENNRFEESRETGIIIGDPKGVARTRMNILTGNTIHTNSRAKPGAFPAVDSYNASDITFCSNQIFSRDSAKCRHKSALIIGQGCRNWIVKDNILRDYVGRAVVYDRHGGHVIKDNLIDD